MEAGSSTESAETKLISTAVKKMVLRCFGGGGEGRHDSPGHARGMPDAPHRTPVLAPRRVRLLTMPEPGVSRRSPPGYLLASLQDVSGQLLRLASIPLETARNLIGIETYNGARSGSSSAPSFNAFASPSANARSSQPRAPSKSLYETDWRPRSAQSFHEIGRTGF